MNHLYASPDALAAISANFQKDFKKAPFSKAPRYTGAAPTPTALGGKQQYQDSATRQIRNESEILPLSFSSAATAIGCCGSFAASPPSNTSLALDRSSRASEIYSAPSTSTSTLRSLRVSPASVTNAKGKGGLSVHGKMKMKNLYSSSSLDSSEPKRHFSNGQSVDIIEIDDSDNEHENVHPKPAGTSTSALHISKLKGPNLKGSKPCSLDMTAYDQMRPPGESSKPKLSVSSKANIILDEFEIVDDDVDFYMDVDMGNCASNSSTATSIVSSTSKRTVTTGTSKSRQELKTTASNPNSSRLVGSSQPLLPTLHGTKMALKDEVKNSPSPATKSGASTLVTSTSSYPNSEPKTTVMVVVAAAAVDPVVLPPVTTSDASISSNDSSSSGPPAPGLQPAIGAGPNGVKRRLGMGRITAGYSNKKFKRPV